MARGTESSFLLITPVKNEERYIGDCIDSVVGQSVVPALWVIVNDGSTDGTADIVKKRTEGHPWIEFMEMEKGDRDLGIHYSEICIKGFDRAIERAQEKGMAWKFIGLVDGDISLDPDYFEQLMERFGTNEKLGIASGVLREPARIPGEAGKEVKVRADRPVGGARLWRKLCFRDAPYISTFAPDSVSNVKAKLRGWTTSVFSETSAEQQRKMGAAQGMCSGASFRGRSSHYLGSTALFACLKGIRLTLKHPFYTGPCYWKGYFASYLKRKERIRDPEVLDYYEKELKRAWERLRHRS